ncbi:MAG: glycoside hydrolase family 5 protein [Fibrobacteria bacterium]|nr:glycoside hydrolase family 5 protein [Fibrobacteria bacterium]
MKHATTPSKTRSVLALVLAASSLSLAQLPTAKTIAAEMGMGWNNGNNLEVPGDPLAWGNPLPTQQFIDSVKAGGFKTVRLPAAWNSHATNNVIDPAWIAQVKQVVDYCIKDGLYVILNSHWDEGWLEENISTSAQAAVNVKQSAYWTQIANAFKDYDHHLLFAGANEPAVQDPYGTAFGADRMAVLNSYLQTFIDAVRATGGNNASRTLIVQGPHADPELTNKVMTTMPTDKIADRLMAEVHFYPYQFTLMNKDESWGKVFYYWGKNNHSTTDTERNPTWGEESFVDSVFDLMKSQFVDKGIPVVIGEFGAMKRMTLSGEVLERHIQSRRSFYEYVMSACKKRGMIPVAWDAGGKGDLTMTVFDRKANGAVFDLGLLNAMRSGMGLSKLPGDTSLVPQATSGSNAMKILYSAKDSLYGQVELGVAKPDFSVYDSIIVRAFVNGNTTYDSAGASRYGYVSLALVTMSKSWTWRQVSLGTIQMNTWSDYTIPLSTDATDTTALAPADPTKVDFFALQTYSKAFNGTVYVDFIVFKKKDGTADTLYSFDKLVPDVFKGNVVDVKSIPVSSVFTDQEWKTATTGYTPTSITGRNSLHNKDLRVSPISGLVQATYRAQSAGPVEATLTNLRGETLWHGSVQAQPGWNSLQIPVALRGLGVLRLQEGSRTLVGKIYQP